MNPLQLAFIHARENNNYNQKCANLDALNEFEEAINCLRPNTLNIANLLSLAAKKLKLSPYLKCVDGEVLGVYFAKSVSIRTDGRVNTNEQYFGVDIINRYITLDEKNGFLKCAIKELKYKYDLTADSHRDVICVDFDFVLIESLICDLLTKASCSDLVFDS